MKKRKDGRYVKRITLEDGTIKDFYGETEKEVSTLKKKKVSNSKPLPKNGVQAPRHH